VADRLCILAFDVVIAIVKYNNTKFELPMLEKKYPYRLKAKL